MAEACAQSTFWTALASIRAAGVYSFRESVFSLLIGGNVTSRKE